MRQKPYSSAKDHLSGGQVLFFGLLVLTMATLPFLASNPLGVAALLVSPIFLSLIALQIGMSIDSLFTRNNAVPLRNTQPFPDRNWPLYSLLVPLLHEERMIAQLCASLEALDYPRDSLEILFLVEAHDHLTQSALQAEPLPAFMRVVIVPPGLPQTKPRALNHGLALCTGLYVTVYDAEDIPDPGQLKQAVLQFESSSPEILCLQAHLTIDNGADSWLAMMMLIEYAGLFEIIKPELAHSRLPVALGGTSNHFRRETLDMMGGWDPYNVTEDADMGFRIARNGGFVDDLASETMEEAPVLLKDWMGQRRRWLKGWIQTGLVHSRHPRQVIAQMGFGAWMVAMVQVVGVIAGTLLFPFFTLWIVWNFWQGTLFQTEGWLDIISNSIACVIFLAGLAAMIMPAVLGLSKKRLWHLAPWLVTLPAYQCLVFWASCLACVDMIRRPFHWEKTRHGIGERLQVLKRRI